MKNKMITLSMLKKHIKKCKRYDKKYNFLGFVENQDLNSEVESLFTFTTADGCTVYDWVNGNDKLKQLITEVN